MESQGAAIELIICSYLFAIFFRSTRALQGPEVTLFAANIALQQRTFKAPGNQVNRQVSIPVYF